jgi:hypothetical protein
MNRSASDGSIGWFIDQVLLDDLRRMVFDHRLHYLSFGVMAGAIEFMGACMDEHPMGEQGHSKERFNNAMSELFDEAYRPYVNSQDDLDLYAGLRCGMNHVVLPKGKIGFTNREESRRLGTGHLQLGGSSLVLVAEDLYEDLACAAAQLRRRMARGESTKKLADQILALPSPAGSDGGAGRDAGGDR